MAHRVIVGQPDLLPDLLDILDLLDFVFDFFRHSKSGVEIEDRYPGGGHWPLAGFWRL